MYALPFRLWRLLNLRHTYFQRSHIGIYVAVICIFTVTVNLIGVRYALLAIYFPLCNIYLTSKLKILRKLWVMDEASTLMGSWPFIHNKAEIFFSILKSMSGLCYIASHLINLYTRSHANDWSGAYMSHKPNATLISPYEDNRRVGCHFWWGTRSSEVISLSNTSCYMLNLP